jgi:hypothetical protein
MKVTIDTALMYPLFPEVANLGNLPRKKKKALKKKLGLEVKGMLIKILNENETD